MYGEREVLYNRLDKIEKRLNQTREIVFHLNDYTSQAEKNYYFCFENCVNGYVKIQVESDNLSTLSLGGVQILSGEYFYLERGVYEVLLQTTVNDITKEVKVCVFGEVCYHDNSQIRVFSKENFSIIAQISVGQLSIYLYDGNITLIDKIETTDYDIVLEDELSVYYLTQTGLEKKVYLYPFVAGVVTEYLLEGVSGVKCSKEGVYIIKSGKLYLVSLADDITLTDCNLEVKELFAIEQNKAVYRDYNGKIKLSDFSVSP